MRRDPNQSTAWFGDGDEAWIRGAVRVGGNVGTVGSEDSDEMGLTRRRAEERRRMCPVSSRTLAGCMQEERGFGRAPRADHLAGRLGGAAPWPWSAVACGNTGGSHRFFGTRSRGFGGDTVDLGSWS